MGLLPDGHVLLGDQVIPIDGQVNQQEAGTFAGKITIGETSRASQTLADEWTVSDHQPGLLKKHLDEQTDTGRFAWGTSATWTPRKLHLPPLVTALQKPVGITDNADGLWEYNDLLYVSFGGKIYRLESDGSWSAQLTDVGGAPSDGVVYKGAFLLARGSSYWRCASGAWTNVAEPFAFFCPFDVHPSNKIVGISSTGALKASIDGVSWTDEIGGEVVDQTITKLLTYRNPVDEPAVFAATTKGLIAIDPFTKSNAPTSLQVIREASNGKGTLVWTDGNLYYTNGLALWRYPKTGQINDVGLDREDGLPVWIRGRIVDLAATPNYLVAVVDATVLGETAPETWFLAGEGVLGTIEIPSAVRSGLSALFLYNGSGWHCLYLPKESSTGIKKALFTAAYGDRRLFFIEGGVVKWLGLPEGNYDPTEDPDAHFAPDSIHETGFFDSGYEEIEKLAISLKLRTKGITATETIQVEYAINDSEAWTYLGTADASTVNASGHVRFPFPPAPANPYGLLFYNIRFRFTLSRGADDTKTPILLFYNLRYKRDPDMLLSFTFSCHSSDITELRSMWRALRAMRRSKLLVPFCFRNDDEEEESYIVKVLNVSGMRPAGQAGGGSFNVTVTELESA